MSTATQTFANTHHEYMVRKSTASNGWGGWEICERVVYLSESEWTVTVQGPKEAIEAAFNRIVAASK